MHLQEIFDLILTHGQGHMKHFPLYQVTYVPATFEVAKANGQEMHYQENAFFELVHKVKGVKVTRNVPQYPRHHVTYAPVKFDVATSNG